MSRWRRRALEEIPSFKQAIENSDSPAAMWISLYHELVAAYDSEPRQEKTIQQIYSFAIQCYRNSRNEYMARDIDIFFEYVIGNRGKVAEDLPNRISTTDFEHLLSALSTWFSEEEASGIRKKFYTVKHKHH